MRYRGDRTPISLEGAFLARHVGRLAPCLILDCCLYWWYSVAWVYPLRESDQGQGGHPRFGIIPVILILLQFV